MSLQKFIDNILKDLKVDLTDDFDRNFERKAFFDKAWPRNKLVNRRGSQMARTNNLRRSIMSRIQKTEIVFSSSLPYAKIQNDGGEIVVTKQMKKYFWAMYYQAGGYNKGNPTIEAIQFKNLALMPVGKRIKIPARRFIGDHPLVRENVRSAIRENLKHASTDIANQFRCKL